MKDKNLRRLAVLAAFNVKFLTSRKELFLYSKALYSAMKWGQTVK